MKLDEAVGQCSGAQYNGLEAKECAVLSRWQAAVAGALMASTQHSRQPVKLVVPQPAKGLQACAVVCAAASPAPGPMAPLIPLTPAMTWTLHQWHHTLHHSS